MIGGRDTIFALASARGRAGVSVFRVSGPEIGALGAVCPLPRVGGRGVRLLRAADGSVIDEALVLRFGDKASFTGESVVEFQTHGSAAVVVSLLSRLGQLEGFRMAEPGEFTRRALENGRLDLAKVEGLSDLIDAETEVQRAQALALMQGRLSDRTERWRRDLIKALALLEATIDFADEDVPVDVKPDVQVLVVSVLDEISNEIVGSFAAERVRDGFEVAIVGRPNVGKSTLLNRIAGRAAAITSDVAGTTRDVVEVRFDLGGLPVTFLDTAGLRKTDNSVEKQGVTLAKARAEASDLRIFLVDDADELGGLGVGRSDGDQVVMPKADLRDDGVGVSGLSGAGVDALLKQVGDTLSARVSREVGATRARHRQAMEKAVEHLRLSLTDGPDELVSEELRSALSSLDSLVGRVDVESVLDVIFAEFCLGK